MKKYFIEIITTIIVLFTAMPCMAERRVIVFGLDETGSYSFRKRAVDIAKSVIADLKPGDTFYLRQITDKSYLDSCSVFRLSVPDVIEKPKNEFDRGARATWLKNVRQAGEVKTKAIDVLSNLNLVKSSRTDIFGFLSAASDRFETERNNISDKIIIIASDMKDNCNRKAVANLVGVKILVAGFETGENPVETKQVKEKWTKILEKCNAKTVLFLPADTSSTINYVNLSKGELSHDK